MSTSIFWFRFSLLFFLYFCISSFIAFIVVTTSDLSSFAFFLYGFLGWLVILFYLQTYQSQLYSLLIYNNDTQIPNMYQLHLLLSGLCSWIAMGWAYSFSVVLFYSLGFVAFCIPIKLLAYQERYVFLKSTLRICSLSIHTPIQFTDILQADIFTSFSKPLSEIPISLGYRLPAYCVGILSSLPYVLRFKQCCFQSFQLYHSSSNEQDTKETKETWIWSLLNAFKYAFTLPFLFSIQENSIILILMFMNVSYNVYWDIYHDWGLYSNLYFKKRRFFFYHEVDSPMSSILFQEEEEEKEERKRQRAMTWILVLICSLDFILRYVVCFYKERVSWTSLAFFEITRRIIWMALRIEHEGRKIGFTKIKLLPSTLLDK